MYESPPQKNNLLFSLKLKKTTNLNRNNSLLKLLDLKLRVANNQDLDEIEDQSNQNPLFKVSNSSDFFKNTNCTENKTIYSTITKTNNNFDVLKNPNQSFNSFKSYCIKFYSCRETKYASVKCKILL